MAVIMAEDIYPVAVSAYPYISVTILKNRVDGLVGKIYPFVGSRAEIPESDISRRAQKIFR